MIFRDMLFIPKYLCNYDPAVDVPGSVSAAKEGQQMEAEYYSGVSPEEKQKKDIDWASENWASTTKPSPAITSDQAAKVAEYQAQMADSMRADIQNIIDKQGYLTEQQQSVAEQTFGSKENVQQIIQEHLKQLEDATRSTPPPIRQAQVGTQSLTPEQQAKAVAQGQGRNLPDYEKAQIAAETRLYIQQQEDIARARGGYIPSQAELMAQYEQLRAVQTQIPVTVVETAPLVTSEYAKIGDIEYQIARYRHELVNDKGEKTGKMATVEIFINTSTGKAELYSVDKGQKLEVSQATTQTIGLNPTQVELRQNIATVAGTIIPTVAMSKEPEKTTTEPKVMPIPTPTKEDIDAKAELQTILKSDAPKLDALKNAGFINEATVITEKGKVAGLRGDADGLLGYTTLTYLPGFTGYDSKGGDKGTYIGTLNAEAKASLRPEGYDLDSNDLNKDLEAQKRLMDLPKIGATNKSEKFKKDELDLFHQSYPWLTTIDEQVAKGEILPLSIYTRLEALYDNGLLKPFTSLKNGQPVSPIKWAAERRDLQLYSLGQSNGKLITIPRNETYTELQRLKDWIASQQDYIRPQVARDIQDYYVRELAKSSQTCKECATELQSIMDNNERGFDKYVMVDGVPRRESEVKDGKWTGQDWSVLKELVTEKKPEAPKKNDVDTFIGYKPEKGWGVKKPAKTVSTLSKKEQNDLIKLIENVLSVVLPRGQAVLAGELFLKWKVGTKEVESESGSKVLTEFTWESGGVPYSIVFDNKDNVFQYSVNGVYNIPANKAGEEFIKCINDQCKIENGILSEARTLIEAKKSEIGRYPTAAELAVPTNVSIAPFGAIDKSNRNNTPIYSVGNLSAITRPAPANEFKPVLEQNRISVDNINELISSYDRVIVSIGNVDWCQPCQNELRELIKIQNQYADSDVAFLYVQYGDDTQRWLTKNFDIFNNQYPSFDKVINSGNVTSIPANLVFEGGQLKSVKIGQLDNIEELLKGVKSLEPTPIPKVGKIETPKTPEIVTPSQHSDAFKVSGINVTDTVIRDNKITITWVTDIPSTSQVMYCDASGMCSSTAVDNNLVTNHKVVIDTSLLPTKGEISVSGINSKDKNKNEVIVIPEQLEKGLFKGFPVAGIAKVAEQLPPQVVAEQKQTTAESKPSGTAETGISIIPQVTTPSIQDLKAQAVTGVLVGEKLTEPTLATEQKREYKPPTVAELLKQSSPALSVLVIDKEPFIAEKINVISSIPNSSVKSIRDEIDRIGGIDTYVKATTILKRPSFINGVQTDYGRALQLIGVDKTKQSDIIESIKKAEFYIGNTSPTGKLSTVATSNLDKLWQDGYTIYTNPQKGDDVWIFRPDGSQLKSIPDIGLAKIEELSNQIALDRDKYNNEINSYKTQVDNFNNRWDRLIQDNQFIGDSNQYAQYNSEFSKLDDKQKDLAIRADDILNKYETVVLSGASIESKNPISQIYEYATVKPNDFALGLIPVAGTAAFWGGMNPLERGLSVSADALFLIPAVRGVSAYVRAGTALQKAIGNVLLAEAKAPITSFTRPKQTIKAIFDPVVTTISPKRVPIESSEIRSYIVKLPVADVGSKGTALEARDILTRVAEKGETPKIQIDGKEIELATTAMQKTGNEGIAVHTSPDLRWALGGADVDNLFVSPNIHTRLTRSSATGLGFTPIPETSIFGRAKVEEIGKYSPQDIMKIDAPAIRDFNLADAKNISTKIAPQIKESIKKYNGMVYGSFSEWLKSPKSPKPNDIDIASRSANELRNEIYNIARINGYDTRISNGAVEIRDATGKYTTIADVHDYTWIDEFYSQKNLKPIEPDDIDGIKILPLGEQYLRQGFGVLAGRKKRAVRVEKLAGKIDELINEYGFTQRMPGALIIRDEELLKQLKSSGVLYKGTAEIESVLKAKLPAPSQILKSMNIDGTDLNLLVIGKPFTQSELAKLKFVGAIDTIKDIFRPAYKIDAITKASDDLADAVKESKALSNRIQIAEESGDSIRVNNLRQELANTNRRIEELSRRVDVIGTARLPIRPAIISTGDYLDRVNYRILASEKPNELARILYGDLQLRDMVLRELPKRDRDRISQLIEVMPSRIEPQERSSLVPRHEMPYKTDDRVLPIDRQPRVVDVPRSVEPTRFAPRVVEPPRVPEVPKPIKQTIPEKLSSVQESVSKLSQKQLDSAIAWKQGKVYRMWVEPYNQKSMIVTHDPIPGVEYHTGVGSAYRSVTAKYGQIPRHLRYEMGIQVIDFTPSKDPTKPLMDFSENYNKYGGKQKRVKTGIVKNGNKHVRRSNESLNIISF